MPVPEIQPLYNEGNIPLAAGYLQTYAEANASSPTLDIRIIPRHIANFGGDAAILEWLMESQAGIVGFTSYMWNVERNILIARRLKKQIPGIITIFGGPEISPNHWTLYESCIDYFIVGEGEQTFIDLAIRLYHGLPAQRIIIQENYLELRCLPNPYLQHIIIPAEGESMFLETMRGCPYHCKYCFYSKSYSRMRYFPEEIIHPFFALARQYKVPEVYIMDPSLNVAPGLEARLDRIAAANDPAIPLHTEIRLESVTPEIARAMKRAGFHSAEVGLQSINPRALKAIQRSFDREGFIAGAGNLQEHDIDAKTGVILGLPFDTARDFEATIEFLIDLDLHESMEIYPLSILPGTRLKDEAESLGVKYMNRPPYQVISTPAMPEEEILSAIGIAEDRLGIEFFPPVIPLFRNQYHPLLHFLDLRFEPNQTLDRIFQNPCCVGHSITVMWSRDSNHPDLRRLAAWLEEYNPSTLVQLVIDRRDIPTENEIELISSIWHRDVSYFDRIHRFKIHRQPHHAIRVFHLTDNLAVAESYLWQPQFCDLLLRYSPKLLTRGMDILEEKPLLLIDTPIPDEQMRILSELYLGFESFLVTIP